LSDAIQSCLLQTTTVDEIIVIDDGSTDNPASIVARYGKVRLIRQENRGLAAARNTGIAATDAIFLTFLDADDRLLPEAMEVGIRHLEAQPNATMVYGAHRMIDMDGRPVSAKIHIPVVGDAYLQLLRRGNFIGMHATVVYRRERLSALGGFDERFVAVKIMNCLCGSRKAEPIISHKRLVAEYRKHGLNMSNNRQVMLAAALRALDVQLASCSTVTAEARRAIAAGRIFWTDYYAAELPKDGFRGFRGLRRLAKLMPSVGRLMPEGFWTPSVGGVKFGDFARTRPISNSLDLIVANRSIAIILRIFLLSIQGHSWPGA